MTQLLANLHDLTAAACAFLLTSAIVVLAIEKTPVPTELSNAWTVTVVWLFRGVLDKASTKQGG